MLQQTTVATVKPYFEKFLLLFPDVYALANARDEQVMAAWAGLGYYSRARNLLKCARQVVAEHDGRFPDQEADLLTLPGIGPYTAAAIAAIAFNRKAAPVDGNIERVLARIHADTTPMPELKKPVKRACEALVPDSLPVAAALLGPSPRHCRDPAASGPEKTQARARGHRLLD
jgi:A/G-specific adenine glycosylase